MKGYLLLALTLTVAQAVTHALTNTPLYNYRNYNPVQYQGQLSYSSPRLGISGQRDVIETLQHEQGNVYRGQREGRFLTRDHGDNYRGIQYAVPVRPQRDWSAVRGQVPSGYFQQQGIRRFQDADSYAYSRRNPQIHYSAPLANTRSFNPRFDATGNQQNEYRFY